MNERVKRNNRYWRERAIQEEAGVDKLSAATSQKMAKLYRQSYRRLTSEINALYAEILDNGMEDITRTQLYNLNHYRRLRDAVANEVKGLADAEKKSLDYLLDFIAVDTYKGNFEALGIEFDLVSELSAKAIATENWSGITYSNRIWKNADNFNVRVMDDVESLIVSGKLPADVKRQLMKDYDVRWDEADRLIRTESSRAYNKAARDSYTAAGIDMCEFLAESDCCDICREFKGRKMPTLQFPELPMHPNCRCTIAPIVEGFK
jgi:SPP1 gp7 family putative phage head morphogenesis protein